jgi:imidazolonepropionase-like amidohydrolase
VSVGFGTDLMGLLEDEQLLGLRLQAEVDGIWTALASATSVNAELIGRPDLGRVAEGCTADLLILGGNICDDPSVVWSPDSQRMIVQDGASHRQLSLRADLQSGSRSAPPYSSAAPLWRTRSSSYRMCYLP